MGPALPEEVLKNLPSVSFNRAYPNELHAAVNLYVNIIHEYIVEYIPDFHSTVISTRS